MVGRGQCRIHAKQPRTAIGQARAHRSGLGLDQKKLSSRGEEPADLVVDTGEGRARPPLCGPPARTPAAGSGGCGRGNGSLFPFQQLKPQNKDDPPLAFMLTRPGKKVLPVVFRLVYVQWMAMVPWTKKMMKLLPDVFTFWKKEPLNVEETTMQYHLCFIHTHMERH